MPVETVQVPVSFESMIDLTEAAYDLLFLVRDLKSVAAGTLLEPNVDTLETWVDNLIFDSQTYQIDLETATNRLKMLVRNYNQLAADLGQVTITAQVTSALTDVAANVTESVMNIPDKAKELYEASKEGVEAFTRKFESIGYDLLKGVALLGAGGLAFYGIFKYIQKRAFEPGREQG